MEALRTLLGQRSCYPRFPSIHQSDYGESVVAGASPLSIENLGSLELPGSWLRLGGQHSREMRWG